MTEPNATIVNKVIEHEDGSATYSFDIPNDSRDKLAEIGLEFVIYCAASGVDMQDAFYRILPPLEQGKDATDAANE